MNRNEFTNRYLRAKRFPRMEDDELMKIIKDSYDRDGINLKLVIAQEECAELIQAISKKLRGKEQNDMGILEEMADVYIVLEFLKIAFHFDDNDILSAAEVKLHREGERMGYAFKPNIKKANIIK